MRLVLAHHYDDDDDDDGSDTTDHIIEHNNRLFSVLKSKFVAIQSRLVLLDQIDVIYDKTKKGMESLLEFME